MNGHVALRVAQFAEGTFALLALLFALSLPWPPRGSFLLPWMFWSSFVVAVSWLTYRLGRPTRLALVTAGVLGAIVLLLSVRSLVVIGEPFGFDRDRMRASQLLASLACATQLLVLICLWLSRKVLSRRHSVGPASTSA